MANIYPDKGYFEVGTDEQQLQALRDLWSGKHREYNESTSVCGRCQGKGYTRKTRTKVVRNKAGSHSTIELGSGCPVCFGTGKVAK